MRVLYLSQSVGFVHETVRRPAGGLSSSELALQEMARDSGAFTVELTQDARDLAAARLAEFDVLIFSTTGALPIGRETWTAIIAWIESGRGGFVGIHSAADTALDFEGGQEAYTTFLGGRFDGHPWTQGTPIRLSNLEPAHPLAAAWSDGTPYAEEIYQYAGFVPDRVRVLQTLDMTAEPLRRPYPVPVTWVRHIGQGRLFYTNLGHTPSTWDDPRFRNQIVNAIRWTGHQLNAPAAPNPDVQDAAAIVAFAAAEGLDAPSSQIPPGLAETIRRLQTLHPEKHDGDASGWDAARARVRAALPQ
ncbi:ThuA domain-containing protein [uncultured Brevundimonas sp.]|uniref:ThuA domain-containing protein n=1 Tax=uncultured Brevundimonas sp. TaxID=213418 RepID=UPI00260386F6|nr:ThuA domain-containing protein [uncultured Brevundimonas sp.]